MFDAAAGQVRSHPSAFPALLSALDYALDGDKEVALVGNVGAPAFAPLLAAVRQGYHPNLVVAAGRAGASGIPLLRDKTVLGGKPTAYVCEKRLCKLPTSYSAVIAGQLATFVPLQ